MSDSLKYLPWLILFLPLIAAAGITLFTLHDRNRSAVLSIGAVGISFGLSILLLIAFQSGHALFPVDWHPWLHVGDLNIEIGFKIDALSLLMLLIVTGVGGAIHIYSFGYMHEDRAVSRYFACLSLFTFSMLGIVLANNFVMMYIFWELVGLSSYLLIGHWWERESAGDAAKKAFITNRLGDFGFLLGIILIWAVLGTVKFDEIENQLRGHPDALGTMAALAGVLVFCGTMGKSAQFPLHVWLPDAMEGPTPVSALIHAATMVAAGVFMLCRVFFIFNAIQLWPDCLSFLNGISALDFIAWLGGFTALLAALIAVQQDDIKRILAYSTLSQLGYMVMAVGLNGPTPAMFHLATHAFFKALLFLGAGSVIHALHHEQNIWKMGGLWKKMPVTFWTFLVGTLALSGVPPFSGFYSKDAILAQAFKQNTAMFILGVIVAGLTTFYMFRLVFVVFFGRAKDHHAEEAHESPRILIWPLRVLAVFAAFGGVMGLEHFIDSAFAGEAHGAAPSFVDQLALPFQSAPLPAFCGLVVVVVGFALAFVLYWNASSDPLPAKLGALSEAMKRRFYFDEIYTGINELTNEACSVVADWFDRWIIAGLGIRGLHGTTEFFSRMVFRQFQSGNLQTYAFLFAAGVGVILYMVLK